jgi:glycosyltransferase involved in cell wall biosynthesis
MTKSFLPTQAIDYLILAGSNSIHTWRYLKGISPFVGEILLIGGGEIPAEYRPHNLRAQLQADFSFTRYPFLSQKINNWLNSLQLNLNPLLSVLHIHQANSIAWHLFSAIRKLPIPKLLTCYGSDVLLSHHIKWRYFLLKQYIKNADYITVPSYEIARIVSPIFSKINALSILNFGIQTPKKPILAKQKYILSTRLHKPLYQIDAILRAWQKIEAICSEWSLIVAGEGNQTNDLKNLAQQLQLKRIKFTGWVNERTLENLYMQSAIAVSVPQSDAVSLSLLESMAYGCIPLVSNIPANLEAIIDGVNGIVHTDSYLVDLSDSLLRAIYLTENKQWIEKMVELNWHIIQIKGLHHEAMASFAAIYRQMSKSTSVSF